MQPTLKVGEAADLLGISLPSARKAVAAGQIPVIRIGRRHLVPTAKLLEMFGLNDQGPQ